MTLLIVGWTGRRRRGRRGTGGVGPRRWRHAARIRRRPLEGDELMVCGSPSSVIVKSPAVRPSTGLPSLVGDSDVDDRELRAAAEDGACCGACDGTAGAATSRRREPRPAAEDATARTVAGRNVGPSGSPNVERRTVPASSEPKPQTALQLAHHVGLDGQPELRAAGQRVDRCRSRDSARWSRRSASRTSAARPAENDRPRLASSENVRRAADRVAARVPH